MASEQGYHLLQASQLEEEVTQTPKAASSTLKGCAVKVFMPPGTLEKVRVGELFHGYWGKDEEDNPVLTKA